MVGPFFAVACLQGVFNQSKESIVLNAFSEDVHQGVVLDILETTLDVSFDEPFGPHPNIVYFGEGRLASPFRSESVTVV